MKFEVKFRKRRIDRKRWQKIAEKKKHFESFEKTIKRNNKCSVAKSIFQIDISLLSIKRL